MKRIVQKIRKSIVSKLAFSNSLIILAVFAFASVMLAGFSMNLSVTKERQTMNSYLTNTQSIMDNKLRDMARVSMIAYSDDRLQDLMKNGDRYSYQQQIDAADYLDRLFISLITIRNDIDGIFVFNNERPAYQYSSQNLGVKSRFSVRKDGWFLERINSKQKYLNGCALFTGQIPNFVRDKSSKENYIYLVREVKSFRPNERIGFIMTVSPISVLKDTLGNCIDPDSTYLLLDPNGTILCEPSEQRIGLNLKSVETGLPDVVGKNGVIQSCDFWGKNCMVSYVTSDYSGITLIVAKPTEVVYRDMNKIQRASLLVCLFAILAAILSMLFLTKRTIRPITRLSSIMGSIGKENIPVHLPVTTDDESGRLTSAFNGMMDTINDLIISEYKTTIRLQEAEISQKETQLLYLRSQINPHFLYNTLDTIRIKAAINNDFDVAEMIMELVRFFRLGVDNEDEFTTIEHEVQLTQVYLKLMQRRYPKLEAEYHIDARLSQEQIPVFLLQPLVENCLMHGLKSVNYCGKIIIHVEQAGRDDIFILIHDNGVGMEQAALEALNGQMQSPPKKQPSRNHIGVVNVQQRLKNYYPDGYGLTFLKNGGGGITARIKLRRKSSMPPARGLAEQNKPDAG